MTEQRPRFYAGTCTYIGHHCSPWRIVDMNEIVKGDCWASSEQRHAVVDMLNAAYDAGIASVTGVLPEPQESHKEASKPRVFVHVQRPSGDQLLQPPGSSDITDESSE